MNNNHNGSEMQKGFESRINNFFNSLLPSSSAAMEVSAGQRNERIVEAAENVDLDDFPYWFENQRPLWNRIFLYTNSFPSAFEFLSNLNIWSLSSEFFTPALLSSPDLSRSLITSTSGLQLAYISYQSALKDCFQLFLNNVNSTSFLLVHESVLNKSISNNDSMFSLCYYEKNGSEVSCIVENLKELWLQRLLQFPGFQYRFSEGEELEKQQQVDEEIMKNISTSGKLRSQFRGRCIIILGQYSLQLWHFVYLEYVYQKLSYICSLMKIPFEQPQKHLNHLKSYIPILISDQQFSSSVPHRLDWKITEPTIIESTSFPIHPEKAYHIVLSGLITKTLLRTIVGHLQSELHRYKGKQNRFLTGEGSSSFVVQKSLFDPEMISRNQTRVQFNPEPPSTRGVINPLTFEVAKKRNREEEEIDKRIGKTAKHNQPFFLLRLQQVSSKITSFERVAEETNQNKSKNPKVLKEICVLRNNLSILAESQN
jgi:hypothetical protein